MPLPGVQPLSAVQSRVGGVQSQSQSQRIRLTSTNRQLNELPQTLAIDALGNGLTIQIRDKCRYVGFALWTKKKTHTRKGISASLSNGSRFDWLE